MFGLLGLESQEQLGWGAKNSQPPINHRTPNFILPLASFWKHQSIISLNKAHQSVQQACLQHEDGRENSIRLLVPTTNMETIYIFLQLLIKSNMRYGNFAAGSQPRNKSITPVLM
jgi:hypothetical protein